MKKDLVSLLICPACLPGEVQLKETVQDISGGDIETGALRCPQCRRIYPIAAGVADLDPNGAQGEKQHANKYETLPVLSSYLWSHYADILQDESASDAYRHWADLLESHAGLAIDAGAAVGRFTFEMSRKCDLAVGIDNSRAFIKTARELMKHRTMTVPLKQEGNIFTETTLTLPPQWDSDRVEFIVADALALPFRAGSAASLASLNLIDKVPRPLRHLEEMNRVTLATGAQFLLSDPFSWSEEAAVEAEWLGGSVSGPFAGRGLENVISLLTAVPARLSPRWEIRARGEVWWKIRTHANHFEQIRSCYVKAQR
ncbi:MAG: methyltransferase domain-containing protein [Desulfobulbaceae bacterium]